MSLIDEMNAALALLCSNNRRLVETILTKEFGGAHGTAGLSEVEAQQVWVKPRFRVSQAAEMMSIHPRPCVNMIGWVWWCRDAPVGVDGAIRCGIWRDYTRFRVCPRERA
ncbi:hypothetical protein [Mobiluncus curtisii]|uniref:Uncharacterized protein n=1 Tax=Mobiluncus curtisii TaxID=2051 RepID=A0A2X3B919_9ACTO|nr:Uncharacterised protein [Mobiluncus curtisii]